MTATNRSKLGVRLPALLSLTVLGGGCATSGTEPHAMTAGQHEAAAKSEEHAAKEHNAQHDPSATIPPTIDCPFVVGVACFRSWTSVGNPTAEHLAEGKRHAELARQHRAASQALRDAEARACRNVPEGDRDISPFFHREDIVSAGPFSESLALGGRNVIGAEVVFASLPGMTAEWLQRLVDCHLARNAVYEGAAQAMSYCPLAVPRVTARVRSVGNGFAVDVTASDQNSRNEVITRVAALTGTPLPKASGTSTQLPPGTL